MSEIRWIEARPDAQCIDGWSGIVSLDMQNDAWADWPLGEIRGAPRTFTGTRAPAGFDGHHQCATPEQLEYGGEYLPDLPPAPYDAQGYLVCCDVAPPPPPPPPPGCICTESTPLPIATTSNWYYCPIGPSDNQRWLYFDVLHTGTIDFHVYSVGYPIFGAVLYRGTCGGLTNVASGSNDFQRTGFAVTPGRYFFNVETVLTGSLVYFSVDMSALP